MRYFGNIQVRGEKSLITLDPTPNSSNPYSGWISWEKTSGVTGIGQALYYDKVTKLWKLAKADSINTMPCRAISVELPNKNGDWGILRFGTSYLVKYHWLGQSLYVDSITSGKITDIQPSSIGSIVQVIGTTKDDNIAFFDFCPICVEVG